MGPGGASWRDQPQLATRIPHATLADLRAASRRLNLPMRDLVALALGQFLASISRDGA